MKFLVRTLTGLVVAALTAGLLVLAVFQIWQAAQERASRSGPARQAQEMVYTASLLRIEPQELTPRLDVYGTVQARRRLELRAGSGGQIIWMAPELHEGGQVRQGQLLLRLDPASAEAARDTQRAALADARQNALDAEAMIDIARDDLAAAEAQARLRADALRRQQDLGARGLGTSAEREAAALAVSSADQAVLSRRSALAQAESAVGASGSALQRAEIALREAERALADTEIRAGFAGRVTEVAAVEGGLVSANEQLAQIIDPASLEVMLPLSLDQYSRLAGAGLERAEALLIAAPGTAPIPARLDRAAASVAEGGAGRTVFADIGAGGEMLRPGDFVLVQITEPPVSGAALVPAAAIGGDGAVLVAAEDGRLSAHGVEVLHRQGNEVIIAVPPALAGARIVAERAPQLGTGIRVREPGAPAEERGGREGGERGRGGAQAGAEAAADGAGRGEGAAAADGAGGSDGSERATTDAPADPTPAASPGASGSADAAAPAAERVESEPAPTRPNLGAASAAMPGASQQAPPPQTSDGDG
ncbi:MAG: HlyD family efflux transporter periplasmic adaptor subunit [Paracoccus sp. (in: a-proteobacteria)]|nr:HlyD family efflux transporter periplasmic adaptor subunit [Paracoccus sp. (in: a-proteobacteria)]